MNLRAINYENGLSCIDINLSDKIIMFVDYKDKSPFNIVNFLKSLNLPFEIGTGLEAVKYFENLNKNGGMYYHIRDYILSESRKTTEYLRQRLGYLSDKYDINIEMNFENGSNQYAVSYNFLHTNKCFSLKSYSDIMDCLDILEFNIEEYLQEETWGKKIRGR